MPSETREWFFVFSFWNSEQSATFFDHWIKKKKVAVGNKPPKLGLQV